MLYNQIPKLNAPGTEELNGYLFALSVGMTLSTACIDYRALPSQVVFDVQFKVLSSLTVDLALLVKGSNRPCRVSL